MCKSMLKGQNVPGQTDISRDRWDVSPGQTGRTPGGVPPKFYVFIGFFHSPFEWRRIFMSEIHANLVFKACISCFEVLQDTCLVAPYG